MALLALLVHAATAVSLAPVVAPPVDEDHWPHWRGPDGTGMARGDAPVEWSEEDVRWKARLPGRGHSTPVVWGDRIFLTTADPGEPGGEQAFLVVCIDRKDGEELWRRTAAEAVPHEQYHKRYGSFASLSPVVDGEHVFASFGSFGLYCYDLEGELAWKKDFGVAMETRHQFGEGTSPVVHGDVLVHVFDHEGDSFVVAVDKNTGKETWRVERDEQSTWATPLVTEVAGALQVIVPGSNRVRSYGLETGEVIWECAGLGSNPIPNPVREGDTVLVMTGHRNPNLMAIRLGRKGNLTGTDALVWSTQRGLSYTASPVLSDGKLYCLMDRGFLSCFDARTGKAYYREERLPRGSNYKASPVGAAGKLYLAGETGDVHVLAMGEKLEVLATNSFEDEFFVSSPVIVGGEILLRGRNHLYCVGERKKER